MAILQAITDALTQVLTWFGTVFTSLLTGASGSDPAGTLNVLLVPLCIGAAISLVLLAVRVIKKVCWGV